MTSINAALSTAVNSALLAELGAAMGQLMKFGTMNVTPGIVAGGCVRPAAEPFTASMPQDGKCSVDLGDGYTMTINERSSEIVIKDAQGNTTQIWGDPHVNVNGQHVGDFYGTTTFELNNGTKITINTELWKGNANAYVASQVVVTRGSQALTIDGVSQNQLGDVKVTMGGNGYALDARTADGLMLNERADGKGWTSSLTGQNVTQADFNTTKPGQGLSFDAGLGAALGLWLFAGQLAPLMGLTGGNGASTEGRAERTVSLFAALAVREV